jgi:hypothetical protein
MSTAEKIFFYCLGAMCVLFCVILLAFLGADVYVAWVKALTVK